LVVPLAPLHASDRALPRTRLRRSSQPATSTTNRLTLAARPQPHCSVCWAACALLLGLHACLTRLEEYVGARAHPTADVRWYNSGQAAIQRRAIGWEEVRTLALPDHHVRLPDE